MRRMFDRAMHSSRGLIHVGANAGQERLLYEDHDLTVFWVEPIPKVFAELETNIASMPLQRCARALVAEEDGQELVFNISSNGGASSSILDLAGHRDIWPDVVYVEQLKLRSTTLPTLIAAEGIDVGQHDMLVLDTQGSELLILKGAASLLHGFQYIKTEVADFESYVGCAKRDEITQFLANYGFAEFAEEQLAERRTGGRYFDILYRRAN